MLSPQKNKNRPQSGGLAVYWRSLKKNYLRPIAFRPMVTHSLAFSDCIYFYILYSARQEQSGACENKFLHLSSGILHPAQKSESVEL
jgi:hypothetical protein